MSACGSCGGGGNTPGPDTAVYTVTVPGQVPFEVKGLFAAKVALVKAGSGSYTLKG